jgi:putative DNA primase/helicase
MSPGLAYRAAGSYLAGIVPNHSPQHIVRWNGTFYRWSGTVYCQQTEEETKNKLVAWLARTPQVRTENNKIKDVNDSFVRDAMLALRAETEIAGTTQPNAWLQNAPAGAVGPFVSCPGGVIDLGSLGDDGATPLLPTSPDFFALTELAVTPNAAEAHVVWDAFLKDTFGGGVESVEQLQEAFGYALWPECPYEKFHILFGEAGTGKSTAAETLAAILGAGNVGALTLDRFGERFALPSLTGKLANVVFDSGDIDKVAEGTLKALVSGEPVPIEEKHKPVGTRRLTAKHLIVTNVLPRFHDTSGGIWRRMILIPFLNVCPPEKRDTGLKAKLRAELPAIAGWALRGLSRLRARGGFVVGEQGRKLIAEYRKESNPVGLFLDSRCEADPEGRVSRQSLYSAYRAWAKDSGFIPVSVIRFGREVRALYPQPDEEVRERRGGDRMFVGLRLQEDGGVIHQLRLLAEKKGA